MQHIDIALAYTRLGWHVIPLCWPDENGGCACPRQHTRPRDIGKAPLVPFKSLEAVTEDHVRNWWGQWPKANIGLLLEPSGVLVVDCDGPEAVSEAQQLGTASAPSVQSSRGLHYFFKVPDGVPRRRTTHRGSSRSIDVLAGGYVVLPPSRHRLGHQYAWLSDPTTLPMAPAWAVEWLQEQEPEVPVEFGEDLPDVHLDNLRVSEAMKRLIVEGPAAAPERYASRSEAIFAVILALLRANHTPAEVAAVLLNDEWTIGDKLREKTDPLDAVKSEIGRAIAKGLSTDKDALRDVVVDGPTLVRLLEDETEDWLVEGLLPFGTLTLLGGYGKAGKTTLALHLASALQTGKNFLGFKSKRVPAIYINYEMPIKTVKKMCLDIAGPDSTRWPLVVPRPSKPVEVSTLRWYMQQAGDGPGLLILDTLFPALGLQGEEENLSGEVGPRVRALADLAHDTGWVVMLICHLRKPQFPHQQPSLHDIAGSRELVAAADVIWIWARKPSKDEQAWAAEPGTLVVTGRLPENRVHIRLLNDVCEKAEPTSKDDELTEAIVEILDGLPDGLTFKEIQQELLGEVSAKTLKKTLQKLVKAGVIRAVDASSPSKCRYILTDN